MSKISNDLNKLGYETIIRPSKIANSKAKIIVIKNTTKNKNITQIQVSPGSKRHGDIPYVKISTTNGKYKIVNGDKRYYKNDGKETAKIIFKRRNSK